MSRSLSWSFLVLLASTFSAMGADVPTYDDDVKPLLRKHCANCHGEDRQKAGVNLQTFSDLMKGGSGGEIVVAGRASQSLLFQSITDPDDEARMPPKKPALPEAEIAMIQKWIDSGLKESAEGKSMVQQRDLAFTPSTESEGNPEHPIMPEGLPEFTAPKVVRPLPALALAVSPWAPLVAVSGQEVVRLIHADTEEEIGQLPFPEGVPQVIRFSLDGAVLMVAGGRPVESGKVVIFDVKTGKRLAEIGDEVDAVLAADLSPDQRQVALGGSGKVVKVYSTIDGKLAYKIEKHTDWITSIRFSPDGQRLASADRAGGIHLWDAKSGGILLTLAEHKAAVRALDWRADGKFLASAGEDGLIVWWDAVDGWPAISKANAHPPKRPEGFYGTLPNGVLAARFAPDGSLFTTGRDLGLRLWDTQGNSVWNQSEAESGKGIPIQSAVTENAKGRTLIVGDSAGQVTFYRIQR